MQTFLCNALMEREISVCMTNFALILNDLAASYKNRNEYISRLCSFPLLILDDFGMERDLKPKTQPDTSRLLPHKPGMKKRSCRRA